MNLDILVELIVQVMYLVFWISAPAVAAALVVGSVTGVLGSFAQVQDPTLGFAPRLAAVGVALTIFGGWMVAQLTEFTRALWLSLPTLV